MFDTTRLQGAIDLDLVKKTKLVVVGIGGANQLVENLIRSGFADITAIDFDTVESHNLAVQGWYQDEVGLPKVEALQNRVKRIDPACKFTALEADFMKMDNTARDKLIKQADMLLMMTDNFYVQASGARLALKYQIPAVLAAVYEYGQAGEITFQIPGMTPACHRCAVSSRYSAYLDEGFSNNVVSTGSTMFHTQYLNSAIGLITLALLHRHHSSDSCQFGGWFDKTWSHNLLQLRMSPRFNANFEDKTRESFVFDSCWQEIEPEALPKYNACPDCGGVGNLTGLGENLAIPDKWLTEYS